MKTKYESTYESLNKHKIPKWYDDAKLGIFIHWGLYSVPAYAPRTHELGEVPIDENWFSNNPYAEWYYNSINLKKGPSYEHHIETYGPNFKYDDFIPLWKAQNFDPDYWANLFKEAKAQYVVLTTKHHDGFCLYPSAYTNYNCYEMGPKKDITGLLTNACLKAGLKMGLYYSGLLDWHVKGDAIKNEDDFHKLSDHSIEYGKYSYNQMMELVNKYHPSVIWNDIGWPKQTEDLLPKFLANYYNEVEDGVVNDRFNDLYHDFVTKEYQRGNFDKTIKWEMCRGMGLSFGYNANESDEHLISIEDLISLLVKVVSNNGNLLLNIGPKADGTIPLEQVKRLKALGQWLTINGEGIFKTRPSSLNNEELDNNIQIYYTSKNNDTYAFIDGIKDHIEIVLPNIKKELISLNKDLKFKQEITPKGLKITLLNYDPTMYTLGFKINNL